MLEKNFAEIYTKFKLSLYAKVFKHLDGGKDSLSAVEVFCLEVIYALANAHGVSKEEFMAVYQEKHDRRGGFEEKLLLIQSERGK